MSATYGETLFGTSVQSLKLEDCCNINPASLQDKVTDPLITATPILNAALASLVISMV